METEIKRFLLIAVLLLSFVAFIVGIGNLQIYLAYLGQPLHEIISVEGYGGFAETVIYVTPGLLFLSVLMVIYPILVILVSILALGREE